MKNLLCFFLLILFCSCGNSPKYAPGEATQKDSLSTAQIEQIRQIHSAFGEVYSVSMKDFINDFKSDTDPANEINIWLEMKDAYEKYLATLPSAPDLATKKEIFSLILSRSMMPDKEAVANTKLSKLSVEDAGNVLKFYTMAPDPVDTTKK